MSLQTYCNVVSLAGLVLLLADVFIQRAIRRRNGGTLGIKPAGIAVFALLLLALTPIYYLAPIWLQACIMTATCWSYIGHVWRGCADLRVA